MIQERTKTGLKAARTRGRKGGRPKVLDIKKRALAARLYTKGDLTITDIWDMTHVAKPTRYRYLKDAGVKIGR